MIFAVISIVLTVVAVVLSYYSTVYSSVVAFLGLCCAGLMPQVALPANTYIFWGVAMLIVVALGYVLPPSVTRSRLGMAYIAGASLAGMLAGLSLSHAAMITGAFAGALLGGVAFAKTPKGKALEFPTSKFFNYLCAKGLPVVITMSIAGTTAAILYTMWPD